MKESQTQQLDRGALRGDGCVSVLNRKACSSRCWKELRPDLFSELDSGTVIASDRVNMNHKRRIQDDAINGIEQQIARFVQTPVELEDAKFNGQEILAQRMQELRSLHGQEWILATDGSYDPKSEKPAGWGAIVINGCSLDQRNSTVHRWIGTEKKTTRTTQGS